MDFGGVLADQRSPDREVLDALLRLPDTSFAAHDDPQRIQRLLAEQAEHQAVLAGAPPDRRRELRRAEDELRSAQEEHHWAKYRLDTAHDRLARIGPLSLLRRHGRHEKSATLDDIERFDGDVARAAGEVAGCKQSRDRLSDQVAKGDAWQVAHDWRYGRLASIEAELADLGHIDLRRIPLPERSPVLEHERSRRNGLDPRLGHSPVGPAAARDVPAWWTDRIAEIAAPPLPGRDAGLGMDLGF